MRAATVAAPSLLPPFVPPFVHLVQSINKSNGSPSPDRFQHFLAHLLVGYRSGSAPFELTTNKKHEGRNTLNLKTTVP